MDPERKNQPTCEVGKTLEGEEDCRHPAEVEFKEVPLCRRHASELYTRDRVDLWRALVLQLDMALESLDGERGEEFKRNLELRRADAVLELELARENLANRA